MTHTDDITVPCIVCGGIQTWHTRDSLCTCTKCGHDKCLIVDVTEYVGRVNPVLLTSNIKQSRNKMAFFNMTPHGNGGIARGEGPPELPPGQPPMNLPWWGDWGGPILPGT